MRSNRWKTVINTTATATLLLARVAMAGTLGDSLETARLDVRSDLDSAAVYLDTLFAGNTPLVLDRVATGIHIIRVLPPHPDAWSVRTVTDTLSLLSGETRMVSYQLRAFIPVQSDPPGAEVYLNDSLAGITPLLLRPTDIGTNARMVLRKEGFEPAPILPSALAGETALTVALKAGWQPRPGNESPFLADAPVWNARRVGLFVSGGVSVLAGIGAAYFKIAADDRQEAFLATGDPALASERKRLDTLAGISLVFAQAGIMVLSYLLVGE